MVRTLAFALAATALLAGCGRKADDKAQAAGGEVLPGTISDGMINLDLSTAEPPLEAVQGEPKGAPAPAPAPDASATAAEAAPEAAAVPAANADPAD